VTIEKKIMEELKAIRKDSDFIKKHIVDRDTILTFEEEKTLEEAMKELREGKAVKLEKLDYLSNPFPHDTNYTTFLTLWFSTNYVVNTGHFHCFGQVKPYRWVTLHRSAII